MFICNDILLYMSYYYTALYMCVLILVYTSGMFKYQHVSTGSKLYIIVNCPRVACPFDGEQQACYVYAYADTPVCGPSPQHALRQQRLSAS